VPPTVALLNYIRCVILWRIFAKLGHFAGFYLYRLFTGRISEAAKGLAGVGGHNIINITITELYCNHGLFPKLEYPQGFHYIILISPEEQRCCDGGGGGGIVFFRLQRTSVKFQPVLWNRNYLLRFRFRFRF
jgi:hypothetical protein